MIPNVCQSNYHHTYSPTLTAQYLELFNDSIADYGKL